MINLFKTVLQWMFSLPKTWCYLSAVRNHITMWIIFFILSTIWKIIFIITLFMISKSMIVFVTICTYKIFIILMGFRQTAMRIKLLSMNLRKRSFFLIYSIGIMDLIFLKRFRNDIFWFAEIIKAIMLGIIMRSQLCRR